MSEWIPHDGSGCPVPKGTLVDIKRFNGVVQLGIRALTYASSDIGLIPLTPDLPISWDWSQVSGPRRIIAYRICKPDAKEARRAVFQSMLDGVRTKAPEEPKRVPEKKRVRT